MPPKKNTKTQHEDLPKTTDETSSVKGKSTGDTTDSSSADESSKKNEKPSIRFGSVERNRPGNPGLPERGT